MDTNTVLQIWVDLPFRSPGNVIRNRAIEFDISKEETFYKAIPVCMEEDKVLFSLPDEICFAYHDGKAMPANGTDEKYLLMIANISGAMNEKDLFF